MAGLTAGHGIVGQHSIHDISGSSGAEAELLHDGDDTVVEAAGSEGLAYRYSRAKIPMLVYPVGHLTPVSSIGILLGRGNRGREHN